MDMLKECCSCLPWCKSSREEDPVERVSYDEKRALESRRWAKGYLQRFETPTTIEGKVEGIQLWYSNCYHSVELVDEMGRKFADRIRQSTDSADLVEGLRGKVISSLQGGYVISQSKFLASIAYRALGLREVKGCEIMEEVESCFKLLEESGLYEDLHDEMSKTMTKLLEERQFGSFCTLVDRREEMIARAITETHGKFNATVDELASGIIIAFEQLGVKACLGKLNRLIDILHKIKENSNAERFAYRICVQNEDLLSLFQGDEFKKRLESFISMAIEGRHSENLSFFAEVMNKKNEARFSFDPDGRTEFDFSILFSQQDLESFKFCVKSVPSFFAFEGGEGFDVIIGGKTFSMSPMWIMDTQENKDVHSFLMDQCALSKGQAWLDNIISLYDD